jgi:hypothetical protein
MGAELPIVAAAAAQGGVFAECFCGAVEIFPRTAGLPAGWMLEGKRAVCPDCAPSHRAAAELEQLEAQPTLLPELALEREPEQLILIPAEAAKGGHHGFRLYSSRVAPDAVVLRLHAGANPVGGAALDRPVHSLMRGADLDELIAALTGIRASLQNRGN